MSRAGLRWALTLAMSVNYLIIALWAVPQLEAMSASNAPPFDLRFFGYGHVDAINYVASLTPGGLAFYLREWRILDSLFPFLLTLTFVSWFWVLYARSPAFLRLSFLAIGFSYGVFDLLENAAVAEMLNVDGGAEFLTPETVARANLWTLLKFLVFALSVLGIIHGFLRMLWVRLRRVEKT